jgi:hypothetical protein
MATITLPEAVATWNIVAAPATVQLRRLAILGVLVLYAASVSSHWFMMSDGALYLMLGENLANGQGYTLWGTPHAHVPPGYPAFLAGMMKLGLGDYLWLNISTLLMTLSILWLSYKYLAGRVAAPLALLVVLTLGYSQEMHMASLLVLSDIFFMLMIWLGMYCYARGLKESGFWLEAGTLALIASCWIRVAGFPLAGAVAFGLLFERRQVRGARVWLNAAALLAGVGLTAWFFLRYHAQVTAAFPVQTYSGYVGEMTARSNWEWLIAPPRNFLSTGRGILRLLTGQQHNSLGLGLVALAWVPTLIGMGVAVRRRHFLGVSAVLGYVLVLTINHLLMARYLLPLAPLLILYFFEGAQCLARWIGSPRAAARTALTLTLILLAFNIPRVLEYTYYVHNPREYKDYAMWESVRQAAAFLKRHAVPDERFLTNDNQRGLSYLSKLTPARLMSCNFNICPPVAAQYDHWIEERGATFVVQWRGLNAKSAALMEEARARHGFRRVYSNPNCDIYCSRPLSP